MLQYTVVSAVIILQKWRQLKEHLCLPDAI